MDRKEYLEKLLSLQVSTFLLNIGYGDGNASNPPEDELFSGSLWKH